MWHRQLPRQYRQQSQQGPCYVLTVCCFGVCVHCALAVQARTVPGFGIMISKLKADFLDTTGHCATIPPPKASLQERSSASKLSQYSSRLRQRLVGGALHHAATDVSVVPEGGRMAPRSAAEVAAVAGASLRSEPHAAASALQIPPSSIQQQQQPARANGDKTFDPGAPCLFKFKGKWYLLAARKMGW